MRSMIELAWARMDWQAARHAAEHLIAGSASPSADDFLVLARACRNSGDFAAAAAAAECAWERAPGVTEIAMVRAQIACDRGDGDLAISHFRELAARAPDNPRWAYELVRLLEMLGRVDEAAREMDAALERMPSAPLLWNIAVDSDFRTLQDAITIGLPLVGHGLYAALQDRTPADDQLRRAPLADQKLRDVVAAPPSSGKTLVIVFTGNNDTVGVPLPIFDRYLAALGCNALYLKDFQRLLFLRGVRSLGSPAATLQAIRGLQQSLGCERLCTIGASGGGFAAIRYGVELAADRILSFCARTHRVADLDAHPIPRRYEATFLSDREVDLRAFLAARSYPSRIRLFFGDQEPRDRSHALYLEGLDGVALHPIPELIDHQCLRWFALNRDLRTSLGQWLCV